MTPGLVAAAIVAGITGSALWLLIRLDQAPERDADRLAEARLDALLTAPAAPVLDPLDTPDLQALDALVDRLYLT